MVSCFLGGCLHSYAMHAEVEYHICNLLSNSSREKRPIKYIYIYGYIYV